MQTNFVTNSNLVTPQRCAELLGGDKPLALATLANWRSAGRYPELRWVKMGRLVRYRLEDIEEFIAVRTKGGASRTEG
jgi:hypothetical protein